MLLQQTKKDMEQLCEQYFSHTVTMRRHLHQHPELSGNELQTADYIYSTLQSWQIEAEKLLDGTAVVACIRGCKDGKQFVLGLRADIDALPIEETNSVDYCSHNKGVMHACGHDVHTANLLTTARILNELKDRFSGVCIFIFQPSEECYPSGAKRLLEAHLLEKYSIKAMIGCHVSPEIPTGKIGLKSGNYMASTDEIYLDIFGKGGHAALPATFINPLTLAAKILVEMEQFCPKYAPKDIPSILTFGKIVGNGQTNVVPDKVHLEGTFRTFDENWRSQAYQKMEQICKHLAQQCGGDIQLTIRKGYPVLYNDPLLTEQCRQWAQEFLSAEQIELLDYRMTADDFAYYSHLVPSFFYRLGTQIPNRTVNLHASDFDVNENIFHFSSALLAYLACNILQ